MSEPRDRRPPAFEIPDLVLPPPRPSQSGTHVVRIEEARAASSSPGASSGVRISSAPVSGRASSVPVPSAPRISSAPSAFPGMGLTLDLEEQDLGGPPIELEHEAEISSTGVLLHYGGASNLSEEDLAPAVTEAIRRSVPPVDLRASWPSAKTPARERLILDSKEVHALANYGEPPTFALLTPLYALRVFFRRRALMTALRAIDAEIARLEADRDQLVAGLGERLRPLLEKDPTFCRLATGARSPVELGLAVLETRGSIEVDRQTIEGIREADERVRKAVTQSELHLRALDACDEDKVKLGTTCAVVVAAALAGLLLWSHLS